MFTETSPPGVEVFVGRSVTLKCAAQGNPRPTITWSKDGRPINPQSKVKVGCQYLKTLWNGWQMLLSSQCWYISYRKLGGTYQSACFFLVFHLVYITAWNFFYYLQVLILESIWLDKNMYTPLQTILVMSLPGKGRSLFCQLWSCTHFDLKTNRHGLTSLDSQIQCRIRSRIHLSSTLFSHTSYLSFWSYRSWMEVYLSML